MNDGQFRVGLELAAAMAAEHGHLGCIQELIAAGTPMLGSDSTSMRHIVGCAFNHESEQLVALLVESMENGLEAVSVREQLLTLLC